MKYERVQKTPPTVPICHLLELPVMEALNVDCKVTESSAFSKMVQPRLKGLQLRCPCRWSLTGRCDYENADEAGLGKCWVWCVLFQHRCNVYFRGGRCLTGCAIAVTTDSCSACQSHPTSHAAWAVTVLTVVCVWSWLCEGWLTRWCAIWRLQSVISSAHVWWKSYHRLAMR